jgi:nucleotide-binding universal stress UspA family protein
VFDQIVATVDDSPSGEAIRSFARVLANRCHASLTTGSVGDHAAVPIGCSSDAMSWATSGSGGLRQVTRSIDPSIHHEPEPEPLGLGPAEPRTDGGRTLVVTAWPAGPEPPSGGSGARPVLPPIQCPLLLVPAGEVGWLLGGRTPRRFLVVLRGDVSDESILDPVVGLAQALDAHVTLLSVVVPMKLDLGSTSGPRSRPPIGVRVRAAQLYLDRMADRLRARGQSVASIVETSSDPGGAVVDHLRHDGHDLVAVIADSPVPAESGLGEIAETVIGAAVKPVFLIRSDSRGLPPPMGDGPAEACR